LNGQVVILEKMTRIKVICDPAGTSRYLGTKIKSSYESVCAGQRLAVQYLYGKILSVILYLPFSFYGIHMKPRKAKI
jgi:hypothetical protein